MSCAASSSCSRRPSATTLRTGQPDCEDPVKAQVMEAVEKRLAELEARVTTVERQVRVDLIDQDEPLLYGSSLFGSHFPVGDRQVQLGDAVRRAYDTAVKHGFISSASEWNEMDEHERDRRILAAMQHIRAEAGQ
jgi:hypothetical protein